MTEACGDPRCVLCTVRAREINAPPFGVDHEPVLPIADEPRGVVVDRAGARACDVAAGSLVLR